MPFPTATQLRKAADLSEKIEALQAELSALLGGSAQPAKKERKKGKRIMSAEAREKIAAAQRRRWDAAKKASSK